MSRKLLCVDFSEFKACVCYFVPICFSRQMIALQKLWKVFFISSKKLFSFLRYWHFYIFVFPSFSSCQPLINLKVYDIINCLNKILITYFVWYLEKKKKYDIETLLIDWVLNVVIDRVLNKVHFYGTVMQKMCSKS